MLFLTSLRKKEFDWLTEDDAGSNIVDCGAGSGDAAFYFLSRFPKVRVVALEPDGTKYSSLQKKLSGFGSRGISLNASVTSSRETFEKGLGIPALMSKHDIRFIDVLKLSLAGGEAELFSLSDLTWLERVK